MELMLQIVVYSVKIPRPPPTFGRVGVSKIPRLNESVNRSHQKRLTNILQYLTDIIICRSLYQEFYSNIGFLITISMYMPIRYLTVFLQRFSFSLQKHNPTASITWTAIHRTYHAEEAAFKKPHMYITYPQLSGAVVPIFHWHGRSNCACVHRLWSFRATRRIAVPGVLFIILCFKLRRRP
jgi:hypothetical protein